MENQVQVFNNAEFGQVRTIEKAGEIWFVGKDVCDCLGIGNARQSISYLDSDETDAVISNDAIGRNQEMTVVSEAGLYSLVLRSRKPNAKKFKRWITHEVLPSIRKTGMYINPNIMQNPRMVGEMFLKYADEIEKLNTKNIQLVSSNKQLSQTIEEQKPKVDYYETILQNPSTMPISQIASDYGMSAIAFNRMLHEFHVQYKKCGRWYLYKEYVNQGYMQSYVNFNRSNKGLTVALQWTQKGRLFLYKFLKEKGIFPLIEKGNNKKTN